MNTDFIETLVIELLNVWTTMKEISIIDEKYVQWVKSLVARYRQSQVKAAVKVNTEVLRFYWELGRDIVERDAENQYGSRFYASLSRDLKDALQTDGFSERNLRYMKIFYLLYNGKIGNLPQVVANSNDAILPQVVAELLLVVLSPKPLMLCRYRSENWKVGICRRRAAGRIYCCLQPSVTQRRTWQPNYWPIDMQRERSYSSTICPGVKQSAYCHIGIWTGEILSRKGWRCHSFYWRNRRET